MQRVTRMSAYLDTIGYIAAFLTTASFLPQAIKVWREDDTAAISLGMYSMFVLGVMLWLIYGIMIGNMPITIANIITFILASSILYKKVRHTMAASHNSPI